MGVSNITSVTRALARIGVDHRLVRDPAELDEATAIILPGVGAFGAAMQALSTTGLDERLRTLVVDRGVPILGICLGMQLLAESSEEHGHARGLGLLPGTVRKLVPTRSDERVPNVGWCDVEPAPSAQLFGDVEPGTSFYFVHSYSLVCDDAAHVAATIRYGDAALTAAVEHELIFGCQFHPEKSQDPGLRLLTAFTRLSRSRDR